MTPVLSLSEEQTLEATRTFLLGLFAVGALEVVVGQDNRVPAPIASNYVVMTTMHQARLSTNVDTDDDAELADPTATSTTAMLMPADVTVQLDFHGAAGYDMAMTVQAVARSAYAVDAFAATGYDVTPLYAGDAHQGGFVNGEQQVENTWTLDLHVQCNPILTIGQDFADGVAIGVINVDATYPPV